MEEGDVILVRNWKNICRVDFKQHFNSVQQNHLLLLLPESQACWFSMLFNALWLALQWLTQHNEWRKKFFLPLSCRSICWKKMSQTPLKVIGLDHHYAFYSMSWGCLGHFCWKIHLFKKIHFIHCSRTKEASSGPAAPPTWEVPSFCCTSVPALEVQIKSKIEIYGNCSNRAMEKGVASNEAFTFLCVLLPAF